MPQSLSIASPADGRHEPRWVEQNRGDLRWVISQDWVHLLDGDAVSWLALSNHPQAKLVKKNPVREVHRVLVNGHAIYAKSYTSAGWADGVKGIFRGPPCKMEWDVAQYAQHHGIDAVHPIGYARKAALLHSGTGVLLTEELRNVVPLHDGWEALQRIQNPKTKCRATHALVDATAKLIARAHQYGFEHSDMHAGNMLVQADDPTAPRVLFVDLQKARVAKPVTDQAIIRNLAQLNQWFRRHATLTQRFRFLRTYIAHHHKLENHSTFSRRTALTSKALAAALRSQADRHARKLWAKRDRRAERTGKYFAKIKLPGGWRGHVFLHCKHPTPDSPASGLTFRPAQWIEWLSAPEHLFDPRDPSDILKESHTALVTQVRFQDEATFIDAICKRPLHRNRFKRIVALFRSSRAIRTWRQANALLHRNLPTARPLAAFERRFFGLRLDAFVLTECLAEAVSLPNFVSEHICPLPPVEAYAAKYKLTDALSKLTQQLIACRFSHRDFKAENILVHLEAGDRSPMLTLIDMDGLTLHSSNATTEDEIRNMLARLSHNLEETTPLTHTDHLRFLKRFLASPGKPALGWKQVWADIAKRVTHKRAKKASRTEWKLAHYGRK